ncbi:hypothetical protein T09_4507 [Trichinella sp. T9]|nr:hypothetical protein T09_4507 [Trichinella sp. T9]KRZ83262.1 hypothetical protein T08_9252 [Trichinella sp. T8]
MKNQKKKKKKKQSEGKNELYHEEDATPTSVGSTRRHSFLLPQEASIDPASFQFNILSTGKVPICAWLAWLAACSFTARGELALLFQCVEKNNQQAAIFNSKIDSRRKLCQNSNYEFVIFLHIIYELILFQEHSTNSDHHQMLIHT